MRRKYALAMNERRSGAAFEAGVETRRKFTSLDSPLVLGCNRGWAEAVSW